MAKAFCWFKSNGFLLHTQLMYFSQKDRLPSDDPNSIKFLGTSIYVDSKLTRETHKLYVFVVNFPELSIC